MPSTEFEFDLDGHKYRAGRLSVFDQLHVASQWRDTLLGLALAKKERPADITDAGFREAMGIVLTGGLGRVTPQSREDISKMLLSVVTRQHKGAEGVGWAPVAASDGGMMFQDIQLLQLPLMFYTVLDHNGILDFFSGAPSTQGGARETKATGPRSLTERAG